MPLVMRLTVVSWPAISSAAALVISSPRENRPSGPSSVTTGKHVVAGVVTTRVGQPAHVSAHLSGGLLTPATPGGEVARGWVAGLNEVGGPHSKARFVLARHP